MRLRGPGERQSAAKRALFRVIENRSGHPVPDVVRTLSYRPGFFGSAFSRWVQAALRGPSPWSEGERELMAALVSARNQCVF